MVDGPVVDAMGRPLRQLRVSVTDRCNLRCQYCMPEEEYAWLDRADVLSFEEIRRLVRAFVANGVDKVRLTGGEPLLRPRLPDLVRMLAAEPGITDLAMTTNAVLLERQVEALKQAGLDRVTASLDTLRPERFTGLTRRTSHAEVLAGIRAIGAAGFAGTKIDTVVMRGGNDDELADLIEFGRSVAAEVRFIEYMDVGGATRWRPDVVVSRAEMLDRLRSRYGPIDELRRTDAAPADRFALADGTTFGIIASTTQPFCGGCDRSRLTADGLWYHCLYAPTGTNLRAPLRDGASDAELVERVAAGWRGRRDQGAVVRLAIRNRRSHLGVEALRQDPHLEMHTRGG